MCSGRIDLEFIFKAFLNGEDGVLVGGCKLGECNYTTQGNFDALSTVQLGKRILAHIGLNPERLRVQFMSSSDGALLAEVTDDFTRQIKELGPLGKTEGLDEKELKLKLEAARKLVPYIKLVERERLRVPVKSEEAYEAFFSSEEMDRLFEELIADKLSISEIVSLLKEAPLSTGEISRILDLNPSAVAKHIQDSSKQGLIKYDENGKCYVLA
jgi:coenzyme F420-reducing hydrogenase delta subunit/biotin operon repressor